MKATLVLFFVLMGTGAFAQTGTIEVLHRSAPAINNQNTGKSGSLGCMTIVTDDPLVVSESGCTPYINRASVVVNRAASSLTVDFKEDIPKQRITVAISYEDGQLMRSESFLPKEREQTLSLPELKSTTLYASRYNIAVYQDDKRVLYWGQFVK